jgi:NAD(P)H-dependent flavin oxidoreductase YrpB (nitropropane dioxygenase family)
MYSPEAFRREIRECRERCAGAPFSANLLFPVMRREHVEVCVSERVPVVSLFFGFDRRIVRALHDAGALVAHQVGNVEQGQRALADGADALVAQGAGAGGHVLAEAPLDDIVPRLTEIAEGKPVLAAGGVVDRAAAEHAMSLGASGVWVGTRFLLSNESHAHDEYKARLRSADETLETQLFGMGWAALHRVVPNAATRRWCRKHPLGPTWVRALERATESVLQRLPQPAVKKVIATQRVGRPFFTAAPLVRGMDASWADVTPLYAGSAVTRIRDIRAAAEITRELSV